nr:AraC family transcriptional regulator [Pandoraea horticolens]
MPTDFAYTKRFNAALGAGFESPEAFCSAFRRAFGTTPSALRKEPNWQVWNAVFAIPHIYRTPNTTPPEALSFAICGETHEAVAPNEFGVHEVVIPAGRG